MELDKEAILKANDKTIVKINVPEWGGDVNITVMSGTQRDDWEQSCWDGEKRILKNMRAKMLVKCMCNSEGKLIFTHSDMDKLGAKSSKILNRIFEQACKLNKLTDKDVEELEGNLRGTS